MRDANCPACDVQPKVWTCRYTEEDHLRDGDGRLTISAGWRPAGEPHLILTCGVCGFEYEMDCKP